MFTLVSRISARVIKELTARVAFLAVEAASKNVIALLLSFNAVVEVLNVGGNIAGGCKAKSQSGKDGVSKRRHFCE